MTRPKACNPTGLCQVYSASEMDAYLDALAQKLEALEQRYRTRAAMAEQDGEEQARMVADDVADDLAALRAEITK